MRVAVFLAVVAASAVSALAAGYDDFARGIAANTAGKNDLAISSFTSALTAGDLAATYVPDAYYGRALAYMRASNCTAAFADVNAAIKLKPDQFDALLLRAQLDDCLGNDEAQLADIAVALAVKPNAALHVARGVIEWRKGDFSSASEDFVAAVKLQPSDPTRYLWSAAALMHAGTYDPASFYKLASDARTRAWPGPLFDLYFGKTTPDAVMAAIPKDDEHGRALQTCLANFYVAEWQLWHKEPDAAKAKLREAAEGCRDAYFVRRVARYDFAKLN